MREKNTIFNDNSDVYAFIIAWLLVLIFLNSFWWVIDFNNLKYPAHAFSLTILIVLNFSLIIVTIGSVIQVINYFHNKKLSILKGYIDETVYKTMVKKYDLQIQALKFDINNLKEQNNMQLYDLEIHSLRHEVNELRRKLYVYEKKM